MKGLPPEPFSAKCWVLSQCSVQISGLGRGREMGDGIGEGSTAQQNGIPATWTPSDKVSKSQQFLRPAEPRWMAGVRFIVTPFYVAATSPLEKEAVKGERRGAMRERIKAIMKSCPVPSHRNNREPEERKKRVLSPWFVLQINLIFFFSGNLSPHFPETWAQEVVLPLADFQANQVKPQLSSALAMSAAPVF